MTTIEKYHTAPSEFATPTMAYGGAPMMSEGPAPFAAVTQQPKAPTDVVPTPDPGGMIAAYHKLTEECATLRADMIAAYHKLTEECATLRADNDARGATIEALRRGAELANARADRQAARADKAETELARQKRVTALMARVACEMMKGDE